MSDVALVLDDDAAVRRFVASILKADGFSVVEAQDGTAALAAIASPHSEICVVISDVRMEGLDGISVFEKAAELVDSLPFVFITGYADSERLVSVPSLFPVLTKPFLPSALLACVHSVLKKAPSRADKVE
jgi:two-component system, NtrC family, response regulator GlrR